jgi:two-component system chemotaxis response regulator CheY
MQQAQQKVVAAVAVEGRSMTRVLVADDSPVVRAILWDCLNTAGYHVSLAVDGQAALDAVDAQPFDVVITNLHMPRLGGLGVLEGIKRRGLATEVVILTGSDEMDDAVRALRLGAHDYLLKPPQRLEEIVLTVERAAEKKRLQDENSRLMRELTLVSRTDFLTGLPNRRAAEEALDRELDRVRRYGTSLGVAMLDLDHFKSVNDRLGHDAGDDVLRWFARMAADAFRQSDSVFRFGGEEFVALLPAVTFEGATDACRRFVERVAGTPLRLEGGTLTLTCSIGLTAAQPSDATFASVLARADRALYQAKAQGRNRLVSHQPKAASQASSQLAQDTAQTKRVRRPVPLAPRSLAEALPA